MHVVYENYTIGDRVHVSDDHRQHCGRKGVVKWIGNKLVDVALDDDNGLRTSFDRKEVSLIIE